MQAQCMNPTGKLLLRATTIGCSSFYYLLTAGPSAFVYLCLALNNSDEYVEKLKDPSELEKQFVYEQLQNAGVLNHHLLSVKVDQKLGYAAHSIYGVVSIDPYITKPNLNNLLKKQKLLQNPSSFSLLFGQPKKELENTQSKIDQHKAILQHEAAHFNNHDSARFLAACSTIPVITHLAFTKVNNLFTKSSFMKQLLKIPGGIGLILANVALFQAYKRHREYKADEGVTNDVTLLTAFNVFLQNHADGINGAIKLWTPLQKELFHIFLNSHPWPIDRIKRIEKRIEKVKRDAKESELN